MRMLLFLAAGILAIHAYIAQRRTPTLGLSFGALTGLLLMLYFPLRALVVLLARNGAVVGINVRVLAASNDHDILWTGGLSVILLCGGFITAYEMASRWPWGQRALGQRTKHPDAEEPHPSIHCRRRHVSTALLSLGTPGVVMELVWATTRLTVDFTGGGIWSLKQILTGAFFAGLYLRLSATDKTPMAGLLVLGCLGVLVGSKELLLQLVVVLVIVGPWRSADRRRITTVALTSTALLATLVTLVLPLVRFYRWEVEAGKAPAVSWFNAVSSFGSRSFLIQGRVPPTTWAGHLSDSLLLLSNRLHGFDSVLASASRAESLDPGFTLPEVLLAPVGVLLPEEIVWGERHPAARDFATQAWGLPPSTGTHIAPSVFGQALVLGGLPAVGLLSALFGVAVGWTERSLRSASPTRAGVAMVVALGLLAFERDILVSLVTIGRQALLALSVSSIASHYLLRDRRARLSG